MISKNIKLKIGDKIKYNPDPDSRFSTTGFKMAESDEYINPGEILTVRHISSCGTLFGFKEGGQGVREGDPHYKNNWIVEWVETDFDFVESGSNFDF